ncbi:uncharacterized protein LOC120103797 isoform X2 [Phoenix dactylifera]|uniref:Uncharacterized protein LOC103722222 isoform X2 n=1 Tax=Phoenix dactylifera TaxID=42345 RepID=A0A8B9ARK2_PHODC|nr:uncharacterized protein LOC103722222 isoform X2 [Phoenix dactylifera]XP_038978445.1 uncharacterized protein LOC103722222 isoform X2 [Phoenix dactylifera]XP_038989409.1 uncharacterized protein LOC120103797 isoform X2 [Phoenix dactylifera]XP_038989411.1 uncharacterized protein LOC120103797 isoform X2 [Phoenix dactylifera]XP_038989415.1 uncharacterized protein LOC120103797 isoform X2 [Phoenix dactylifera]
MAEKKGFEGFEPIFLETKADWEQENAGADRRPFLIYVYALDSSRLDIIATDYHFHTWERVVTVPELEDLRDDIGIGGTWSDFVEYLISSLSVGDVKLIMSGQLTSDSGAAHAKLIALKSKGLPRISFSLNRVINSSANDVMADLALSLFKACKKKQNEVVKERDHSTRLMGILSSERERNDSLQKQLDALSFLSKRKAPKSKTSDKPSIASDTLNNYDTMLASEMQESSEMPSVKDSQSVKISRRAAPVSRRAKVRGVSLQDTGDIDDH